MKKQHIVDEIKRTAAENGGRPLGKLRFEAATGIRQHDWSGVFWARWNDAVAEAGFAPNALVAAHEENHLLQKVAALALEMGRFPVSSEMRLKRRTDPTFPNDKAIFNRFGRKSDLVRKVLEYSVARPELSRVVELCRPLITSDGGEQIAESDDELETGYVYLALMKVGREKRYKIGKADIVGRRTRQIAVDLPEELELVHAISTDDAYGIETYWHKRFAEKRRGGEWFELTADDVRVFKRRRFM